MIAARSKPKSSASEGIARMASVQSLRLDSGDGSFHVQRPGFEIGPIRLDSSSDARLSLKALQTAEGDQEFLPLDLVQLASGQELWLLGFVSLKDHELCTIWFLDRDLVLTQQMCVSPLDLATLYRLAGARPQAPDWLSSLCERDQLHHRGWLTQLHERATRSEQAEEEQIGLQPFGKASSPARREPETSGFLSALVQQLSPADPLPELLRQLETDPASLSPCDRDLLLSSWGYACARAVFQSSTGKLSECITNEHRYVLLKELYLLITGQDLIFNPFSGRHQKASLSSFIPTDHSVSQSFSVNKACLFEHCHVQIAELRGPGYSMMVTGYLIGVELVAIAPYAFTSWVPDNYARYAAHVSKYIQAAIHRPRSDDEPIHLVNLSLATNLGHTLWNDISGYYLLKELLEAFPALSRNIQLVSYQEGGTPFSPQSYNEFFQPFLEDDFAGLNLSVISDFQAIADLTRPMMLKSMLAPADVAANLRHRYRAAEAPSQPSGVDAAGDPQESLRILINLRAHNKSLLNTPECLEAVFSSPTIRALRDRLVFCLDMHNTAEQMAEEIIAVLDRHGIAHERLVDSSLEQLCQEISRSAVVIAPVGSALVLPTWAWNKECLVHADPLHMEQVAIWSLVAPYFPDLRLHLHSISLESIDSQGSELYANYRVEPKAFCEQFEAALTRRLASRSEMPTASMFRWYCPFTLPEPVVEDLRAAGGTPWLPGDDGRPPEPEPLLLLYLPPHAVLEQATDPLAGYRQLQKLAPQGRLWHLERLLARPRSFWASLAGVGDATLEGAAKAGPAPAGSPLPLQQPDALTGVVTLALLRETPALLDAYLDLELAGDLGGSFPDSDYQDRLRRACPSDALLDAIRDKSLERELSTARDESEDLRQQLKHSYEQLEQLALVEQGQQEHLQHLQRELETLAQELETNRSRAQELEIARAATEQQAGVQQAVLQTELERLQGDLAGRDGRIQAQEQEILSLRQDTETLRDERENAQRATESARLETEALGRQLQESRSEASGLRSELAGRDREIQAQKRELLSLRQAAEGLQEEAESLRENAEALRQETEDLRQANESARKESESARQEAESARQETLSARQEAEALDRQLQESRSEASGLRSELAGRDSEIQAQKREILSLRQAAEDLQEEAETLRFQLRERQQELEAIGEELPTLHSELEQLFLAERGHLEELDRVSLELRNLREQLAASEERSSADRRSLEQSEEQLKARLQELERAERARAEVLGEAGHLREETARLREESERLRDELTERQQRLEREITTREADLISRDSELGELRERLEDTHRRLQRNEEELERAQRARADEQEGAQRLELEARRARQEMTQRQRELEQQIEGLDRRLQDERRDLEEVRQEALRLQSDLHSTEEELEQHFRDSQHGRRLVEAQQVQMRRAVELLRRMALVKQLPAAGTVPAPIQLLALLEGYRHSLKRAERLLRGAAGRDGGKASL